MREIAETIGYVFMGIGLVGLIAVLITVPFYFVWNWLCPKLFNLPSINLWQSLGILLLSGMLFRSSRSSKKD